MRPRAVFVALALAAAASPAAAQRPAAPWRFVVLGHIRGSAEHRLNPKLGEVLDEVRALRPAFVVLSGDIIWGDVDHDPSRPAELEAEWRAVDSALATLGIPVYRVPGNHDIPDVGARDVWIRRYGRPPAVVDVHGVRLVLLSSAFLPPDGDTTHHKYKNGVDLDSAQLAFLAAALAGAERTPTFVFLGHLLWWEGADGRWWREAHPLLAAAGVRGVFSGDYGPMKFSTLERDGVRYFQSSIEGAPSLAMLQQRPASRLLSSQFDNFLEVEMRGDSARVVVHTVAEVSSGMFTPGMWAAIEHPPPPSALDRLRPLADTWKKKAALSAAILLLFGAGLAAGRAGRRAA